MQGPVFRQGKASQMIYLIRRPVYCLVKENVWPIIVAASSRFFFYLSKLNVVRELISFFFVFKWAFSSRGYFYVVTKKLYSKIILGNSTLTYVYDKYLHI